MFPVSIHSSPLFTSRGRARGEEGEKETVAAALL